MNPIWNIFILQINCEETSKMAITNTENSTDSLLKCFGTAEAFAT